MFKNFVGLLVMLLVMALLTSVAAASSIDRGGGGFWAAGDVVAGFVVLPVGQPSVTGEKGIAPALHEDPGYMFRALGTAFDEHAEIASINGAPHSLEVLNSPSCTEQTV